MTEREAALENEVAGLKEKLAETQRQLDLPVRRVFGKRSEQTPPPAAPGQFGLALETESPAIGSAPPAPPRKPKGGSRKGRKVRGSLWPSICRWRRLCSSCHASRLSLTTGGAPAQM